MRWLVATLFVTSAFAMGCSAGPSGGGGGEGGEPEWGNNGSGGSTGTGKVPLTSVAASSSGGGPGGQVSSSSSGGGGSACDNNAQGCGGCQQCAFDQVCANEAGACFNDPACSGLAQCLQSCQDQTCANNCAMQYPGGINAYNTVVDCIICKACFNDCGGAASGC